MKLISGHALLSITAPERPRYQFHSIMAYLGNDPPRTESVCALYGLRHNGKTTLILQAIRELLAQGKAPERICLYQGEKGDDFKLLIKELDTMWKTLDYLFIDDSHNFSNFILGSNYLYDILVRVFNKKVVIA
ncbi:MAG: AAA family ATPase, partial [Clostridiales bacterium]|nr:AAA family ATPase [Clostridiales bacterium]